MAAVTTSATQEKNSAALTSVIAAVGLTVFKIIVGIATGSLGILAEAAHSGLDLVAALVTFFAVRISGRPADATHHYGHGKVENLSALFETLLLLATCVWIIYESVQRLFFKTVEVEISFWAFAVMAVSILIDYSRSRVLARAAQKYNSQALEADALHFSTDIWSSSVVIVGLTAVLLAKTFPALYFLHKADAVAALGVAGIVIFISAQLGKRTIQALLDSSPTGIVEKVYAAAISVTGVVYCHNIRVRNSGADLFVDMHIGVPATMQITKAHELAGKVEKAVQKVLPGVDVTIHEEPAKPSQQPAPAKSRRGR